MRRKQPASFSAVRSAARWTVEELEKRVMLTADSPAYTGTGLQVQYYNAANFQSFVSASVDSSLDHSFSTAPGGITSATYSIRWSGQLQPSVTGDYTFNLSSSNGGTLWLNGQMLASQDGSTTPIKLILGREYSFELDYEHTPSSSSTVHLQWGEQDVVDPGTLAFSDIPSTSLYPGQRGSLTRQIFTTGFSGGYDITNLTSLATYKADEPDQDQQISSFADPVSSPTMTTYGDRLEGYLYAPVSGLYTFAIAADDCGELDLSTDSNPANIQKIAYVTSAVPADSWGTAGSTQQGQVYLQAGQQYFVQALHTQALGGDNVAVAWELPGSTSGFAVIPGDELSPVLSTVQLYAEQSSAYAAASNNSLANQAIEFQVQRTGSDDTQAMPVSFRVYGSATSSDYTITDPSGDVLTNSITIPAGAWTTTINITPTLGSTSTTWQTADVQLLDGPMYNVPTLSGGSAIGTIMYQSIATTDATPAITSMVTTKPSSSNPNSLNPEIITPGTATISGPTAVSGEPFDWQYEVNVPGPVASSTPEPAAPTTSTTPGGSQPATTYYVRTTYVSSTGEGLASPRTTVTVPASQQLVISSPAALSGYSSYNVYVSTDNMPEVKQNANAIALGTSFDEPTTAPAAPTLSSQSGGTLAATTYYAAVTYTGASGETLASAQANLSVGANHVLVITSPAAASGFTGYNVYVGTAAGLIYQQNTSPIALGTNWTESTAGLGTAAIQPSGTLAPIVQSSGEPASDPNGGSVRLQAFTSVAIADGQTGWIDFWAKNNNTSISSTPEFSVRLAQTAGPSYDALYVGDFTASTSWTHYSEPFSAAYAGPQANSGSNATRLDFQMGGQAQDVLIGGVQVSIYPTSGTGVPTVNTLPLLTGNYQGRSATDPTHPTSQANITANRTSNLTFTVENSSNGNAPIDGAAITLNETSPSFGFGSSVNNSDFPTAGTSNAYNDIIADYFNKATNETNMKWPLWATAEAEYSDGTLSVPWADIFVDQMVSDGLTNIRGHNLVWPNFDQLPTYPVNLQNDTPAQLGPAILTHIDEEDGNVLPSGGPTPYSTVNQPVHQYVTEWDVVNEPDTNNQFFASDELGEWAMAQWYAEAAKVSPNTTRYLNENYQFSDGQAENITSAGNIPSTEDQNYINWVQTFSEIQGMGLESHFDQNATGITDVADTLAYLHSAAPSDKMEVTEYDLSMPVLDQQLQSDYLRDFMSEIYSNPNMTGFVVWDFMNDYDVNGSLWNSDGTIKPDGQQFVDLVWNQWNTFETGTSNGSGMYTADNAYQGTYTITVNYNGITQSYPLSSLSGNGTTASPYVLPFNPVVSGAPAPTVAVAASASAGSSPGTASFSVLGADASYHQAALTYTWTLSSTSPSGLPAPTFSVNGTNAASNELATFSSTGTYNFTVTISDPNGATVTSNTSFTIATPTWLQSGSVANWNPSSSVLIVTGAAAIIADPGTTEPVVQASGSAAVLTLNPSSGTDIHLGGLSLTSGASATVTSLGSARSVNNYHLLVIGSSGATAAPTFTIDSTSTLDLADNDMAILYGTGTSPLANVAANLSEAYNGGLWNDPGLTSSVARNSGGVTALAYGEASALGLSTFDGLTLGGNAVLVKYTLMGDTQLRGSVGIGDYDTVLSNYGTAQGWTGGNFHYGGTVGIGDYDAVMSNYGKSLADVLPGGDAPALVSSAKSATKSSAITSKTKANARVLRVHRKSHRQAD
jgi:GH35 family endo-1,4-beta-xylanase